jgi:iron complex transport system substrate-binding protein
VRGACLGLCVAVGVATAPLGPSCAVEGEPARPARIVSLDLCTDQLLVDLAAPSRIAAVTHLAADPAVSAIAQKARAIPATRGSAEDVLRLDPDLVLAGPFGVAGSVDLLRRLGRNVVVVPLAQDLDGVRASVRAVAGALGVPARGEALIAEFDHRLAALAAPAAFPATAVIYQIGGTVSGSGSLADAMLAAAGLRNMSAAYRLWRGGQVPLEVLFGSPPDLLVLASREDEYRTALADNLRHPLVRRLSEQGASIELPWRYWLCGTPHIADAIELLARARAGIEARR